LAVTFLGWLVKKWVEKGKECQSSS